MNRQALLTVCTADHFQHYIPLFIRAARRWADGVDIWVYVRGKVDDLTKKAMWALDNDFGVTGERDHIVEDYRMDLPFTVSATNCIRFLLFEPELMEYAHVLITDIDLLLFNDPFPWHTQKMLQTRQCFAGHHGPWTKPYRPGVSKEGWRGVFERVAGGFFCIEPRAWYPTTVEQRSNQEDDLKRGYIGKFRESDEVMLARIIKGSGLEVPEAKGFPAQLRGVHLGDFKDTMKHRFTDMGKMQRKLTDGNALAFLDIQRDRAWAEIEQIVRKDKDIATILDRVISHTRERGLM